MELLAGFVCGVFATFLCAAAFGQKLAESYHSRREARAAKFYADGERALAEARRALEEADATYNEVAAARDEAIRLAKLMQVKIDG